MKTKFTRITLLILIFTIMLPFFSSTVTALAEDVEYAVKNTGLPVVTIDINDGSGITDRETYKEAKMHISLTEEYAEYTNVYTEDEGGDLEIKGRGNSSWWQFQTQKRAYNIKLDKKAELFGMDNSKKWCLIANFMDRSNLRNKLAYELSGKMGMTYCESVFVNLYLNGTYMGVYMLCERADVDEEIYEWEDVAEDVASAIKDAENLTKNQKNALEDMMKEDLSWITEERVTFEGKTYNIKDYYDYSEYSLQGGYLIEYDHYFDQISKFFTSNGVPLNLQSPEYLSSNSTMMNYLQQLFADFEEAVYSENFYNSKGHHYSEYVDMESLVDFFIVNAFMLNVEFGYKSNYLYIDDSGLITFGPVWDFDWSSGNHFLGSSAAYDQWYGGDWRTQHNVWYHQLYGDPYFVALVQERWFEVQDLLQETIDSIDEYYNYLNAAASYELQYYLSLPGENDFRNQYHGYSFKNECDALKNFLRNRYNWMNNQLQVKKPNIEGHGPSIDERMIMTISGEGVNKIQNKYNGYYIDHLLEAEYTDVLSLGFSLSSTPGVTNHFEIYVNEQYYTTVESQNFTIELPVSLFDDGINAVSAIRIREGEYYGTRTYLTVYAQISGRKVQSEKVRVTPAELKFVDKTTLINKESSWSIYTTTRWKYEEMRYTSWYMPSYNEPGWMTFTAPFGDRLSGNSQQSGWNGDNHALFARKEFTVDLSKVTVNDLYLDIFYDNTVYVYINGHLVYSDDTALTGAQDWNDAFEIIRLDDAAKYLVDGKNIIAVSVNDDVGGRELDLELYVMENTSDTVYENPTSKKETEETVLYSKDAIRTFVTLSRDSEGDGMGIWLLANNSQFEKLTQATVSVTLKNANGNRMITREFSQLEVFESIRSDGEMFVCEEGSQILGFDFGGINDKDWTEIEIRVIDSGKAMIVKSLSFETLVSHYK